MDLKQAKHWRTQPNVERRFTYNGFLTCASCGQVVHTAFARRDYYACKGRRSEHTCMTKYMVREKLEQRLDFMFADQLTSSEFLETCLRELAKRQGQDDSGVRIQRLTEQSNSLREKRNRVLEAFFDGTISREEHKLRLESIDRDIRLTQNLLTPGNPPTSPSLLSLTEAFAPLVEWEHWTRDQKRSVLAALVPDIRVADYRIAALGIDPKLFSNENTRTDTGSSPLPA